ncbi:MAG: hypothetical protein AD742_01915 [Methylibium sp. NZG]|nr:MAG: hypothetical protein AD742_01915 [Methylibium sp. NZG]
MNSKLLYSATIAIALLGSGAAMASEATQFDIPAGTATRAEVKAELARAQAAGELNQASALYGYVQPPVASVRTRAEVRAEAVQAARDHSLNMLYVGA